MLAGRGTEKKRRRLCAGRCRNVRRLACPCYWLQIHIWFTRELEIQRTFLALYCLVGLTICSNVRGTSVMSPSLFIWNCICLLGGMDDGEAWRIRAPNW